MRRGGVALVLVGLLVAGVVASCGARVDVGVDGVSTRWIRVAAPQPRRALLVTDADRSPSDSDGLPLVLVLHGLGQNAEIMAPLGAFSSLARDGRAVVVVPDGWHRSWNAGRCCGDAAAEGVDDVAYLDALIDEVVDQTGADPRQVHMVGFSNGGMMVYRYLCEGATRLRGAASIAGTNVDGCTPTRPTDFIQISGTDDDVVPLGPTQSPASVAALGQVPPVRTSVERLAEAFSCPPPETTQVAPLTSTRWAPCAGGTTVRLDEVTGLVHIYPSGPGYQGTDQIMAVWGWPPFDPTGRG